MDKKGNMNEILAEGLRAGIEIEKEGIEFYSKAAKNTKDPEGKRTLEYLAKEEREHLKFIEDLVESLEMKGDLPEVIEKYLRRPKVFPEEKEFSMRIKARSGDKEILKEAKKVEERSISFYREASDKVEGEDKRIFEILEGEEKKHMEWIEFMENAMEVHGYWYGLDKYFAFEG